MSDLKPIDYPVTFSFDPPEKIARWRPLVHWLLAIPHLIVLYIFGIVAFVCAVVAWFSGVFTGKIPQGLQEVVAMYMRYNARVVSYMFFLRAEYPAFAFNASLPDDGVDPRVHFDVAPDLEGRNRLTIFFRYFMIIPQAIVLGFVSIALYFVMIVAFFAVIILGRWPAGLRDFVVGYNRWSLRLNAYFMLLTDKYPPFSLQ